MANSTLIVYEPLESFRESSQYWEEYVKYYERYWGGPTSPFGMWFGNEYSSFKEAISKHLGLNKDEVNECLFMKDENGNYFIAPTNNTTNIFSAENVVPMEWFILVSEEERNDFYSHWGFNSIHYDTKLSNSIKRLIEAREILKENLESQDSNKSRLYQFLSNLLFTINNLENWLSNFYKSSFLILNYGDICSYIQPYTLKNENSVLDIKIFLELISNKNIEKAELNLKLFFQKWDDIKNKCMGIQDDNIQ